MMQSLHKTRNALKDVLRSSYSHEAILDIESKNIMTTTTTAGVSASSDGAAAATTSDGNR